LGIGRGFLAYCLASQVFPESEQNPAVAAVFLANMRKLKAG
jgi:hypothetical protein